MRSAGYPMGPFELMDLTGIDVSLAAARGIHEGFVARGDPLADRFRPSEMQERLVEAGRLGRKAGRRVLCVRRRAGRRGSAAAAAAMGSTTATRDRIVERIELAIVNEAYRAATRVCAAEGDIDRGVGPGSASRPRAPGSGAGPTGPGQLATVLGPADRGAAALASSARSRRRADPDAILRTRGASALRSTTGAPLERARSRVGSNCESRLLPPPPRGVDRVRRADPGRPLWRRAGGGPPRRHGRHRAARRRRARAARPGSSSRT